MSGGPEHSPTGCPCRNRRHAPRNRPPQRRYGPRAHDPGRDRAVLGVHVGDWAEMIPGNRHATERAPRSPKTDAESERLKREWAERNEVKKLPVRKMG